MSVPMMLLFVIRAAGVQQAQLARATNGAVRAERLSQILRGRADARPHERRAIATALDLDEQELFDAAPPVEAAVTALLARRAKNIAAPDGQLVSRKTKTRDGAMCGSLHSRNRNMTIYQTRVRAATTVLLPGARRDAVPPVKTRAPAARFGERAIAPASYGAP